MQDLPQQWEQASLKQPQKRPSPVEHLSNDKVEQFVRTMAYLEMVADIRLTKATADIKNEEHGADYPDLYLLMHCDKLRSLNERIMFTIKQACFEDDVSIHKIVDEYCSAFCLNDEEPPAKLKSDLNDFIAGMIDEYKEKSNNSTAEGILNFLAVMMLNLYGAAIKYSDEQNHFSSLETHLISEIPRFFATYICDPLENGKAADKVMEFAMQSEKALPAVQDVMDTFQETLVVMAELCLNIYLRLDRFNPIQANLARQVEFMSVVLSDLSTEATAMEARGLLTSSSETIAYEVVKELSQHPESQADDFEAPTLPDRVLVGGFIANFMADIYRTTDINPDKTTIAFQNACFGQILEMYDIVKARKIENGHLSDKPDRPSAPTVVN